MCLFSCACINPGLLSHPDLDFGIFIELVRRTREETITVGPFIILFFGIVWMWQLSHLSQSEKTNLDTLKSPLNVHEQIQIHTCKHMYLLHLFALSLNSALYITAINIMSNNWINLTVIPSLTMNFTSKSVPHLC